MARFCCSPRSSSSGGRSSDSGSAQSESIQITQFCMGLFPDNKYDPTVEDEFRKAVQLDSECVATLEILEAPGTEQFRALRDHVRLASRF